jgi:hypothetical protein
MGWEFFVPAQTLIGVKLCGTDMYMLVFTDMRLKALFQLPFTGWVKVADVAAKCVVFLFSFLEL